MTSASSDGGSASRQPALDGVRGGAISLVLVYHFAVLSGSRQTGVDAAILKLTGVGWSGVDLFFVLSGFLITGILYDSKTAVADYFRTFYARRVLRIAPVYYLFLFLLVFLLPLVLSTQQAAAGAVHDHVFWYGTYLTNVHFSADPLRQPDFLLTGHLWSLAVEEQFYLLWPAVVFVLGRRQLMALCVLFTAGSLALRSILVVHGTDPQIAHGIMLAHMDALGLGGLVALASRNPGDLWRLVHCAWPAIAVGGGGALALFFSRDDLSPYDPRVQSFGYTALAVLFAGLILLATTAAPGSITRAVWTRPALGWLGKYSYALYLFHWPAATLLQRYAAIASHVPTVSGSTLLGELAFVAAAFALSMSLAWLSWHLWEQPFLRLKSRFPYGSARSSRRKEVISGDQILRNDRTSAGLLS
jgi:peptidoglycan/LPS O-acetylase OafA/YrhL